MAIRVALSALLLVGTLSSCATYQQHLGRGQAAYERSQYELALAIWRDLERDVDSLSEVERVQYAYLRGMTDYRLGFRADARHWLAVANVLAEDRPGALDGSDRARADQVLDDLNREIYRLDPTFEEVKSDSSVTQNVRETSAPSEQPQRQ